MSKKSFLQILRDKRSMTYLSLLILLVAVLFLVITTSSYTIQGTSWNSSGTYNLTAWDDTDIKGGSLTRYTNGTIWLKTESNWNVFFYANYTNSSSNSSFIGGDSNCSIRFNENLTGVFTAWKNMTFSSSTDRYQYNRSFSYKGDISYEVNCTNLTQGRLNISESITITNTRPKITAKIEAEGRLPDETVTEDSVWTYNITLNASVVEDDLNDQLTYSYTASSTNLTNFTLSSNGILTINVTSNQTVSVNSSTRRQIVLVARDDELGSDTAILNITYTAVNDKPLITNCSGSVCTYVTNNTNALESRLFTMNLNASDEENDIPYSFNITFTSCQLANWSTRGNNCTLFNVNDKYVFNKTNGTFWFLPTNNDIGNYTIQINVTDAGSPNASNMSIMNITVINANDLPQLRWNCTDVSGSSLWTATEDSIFSCFVNATDQDEMYNLTFATNISWFTFNNSRTSMAINDTNSSDINSTFVANVTFTANDSMVGLWYANISATDSFGGQSSVVINFNISNLNDSVGLERIPNKIVYTGIEIYFEVNASDDDLLIPIQGKQANFNYSDLPLNFTVNITLNGWNVSTPNLTLFRLNFSSQTGNRTISFARFTPASTDAGNYTVNISVNDYNRSYASQIFNLNITQNTFPYWINFDNSTKTLTEGTAFALNLYSNATDDDGDKINFTTNTSSTDFNSFSMNLSGSISFTPIDQDVGSHLVHINITDTKGAVNTTTINLTVNNINDIPSLAAVNATALAMEDSSFTMWFLATDNDFYIPSKWKSFYNETLNFTINITVANSSGSSNLSGGILNFSKYNNTAAIINFTPTKAFGGNYSINVTVNDSTGLMASRTFTLNVTSINHPPALMTLANQNATVDGSSLFYDINATDIEDGADNGTGASNLTFAIRIMNSTNSSRVNLTSYLLDNAWINITIGTGKVRLNINVNNSASNITNVTFIPNSTFVGVHWLNVSVNDTESAIDSKIFKLTVFDTNQPPTISSSTISNPNVNSTVGGYTLYRTPENCTGSDCQTFTIFITDPNSDYPNYDNFTVRWYVNSVLNKTSANVRNDTATTYTFYTNFSDEGIRNITVIVYDPYNANATMNWSINVTHSNAPVDYSGPIPNSTGHSGTSSATFTMDLGTYFSDVDHSHAKYNQSINFTFKQMDMNYTNLTTPKISLRINNDSLVATFSTSSTSEELFEILACDSINTSIWCRRSNNFTVNFTVIAPTVTVVTTSTGGGGGGGARIPYALKLIVPEPVSIYTNQQITVPIKIQNKGSASFSDITLGAYSTLEGMKVELSKYKIKTLESGKTEKVDMVVYIEKGKTGSYEIILNASSESPKYTDTASFFVNLLEIGWEEKIKAQEKIVFLEELLLGNPECLELTEVLKEAKKTFEQKDYKKAMELAEQAIQACKYAVASKGKVVQITKKYKLEQYSLLIAEILFILILFLL